MLNVLSPRQGGSLVESTVWHIRDHIRSSGLKVGDALPSAGDFANRLGVSKAVMREAFGALAALKVIDVRNGRRAKVGAIDGSVMAASLAHAVSTDQVTLTQVWDVRKTLEFRTVELAAINRSSAAASEIVGEAEAMARSLDDIEELVTHDVRLHQAVARASGNPLFHQIMRSFEPLMTVAVPTAWHTRTTVEERDQMIDCHRALAGAIAARDVEAAHRALTSHFTSSIAALLP